MNLFFSHIPNSRLVDLAEGRLAPDQQAPLDAHLASCRRCSAELAHLERLIGLMRTDMAEDAPAPLIRHAVHLFRSQFGRASTPSGVRHRILAVLRFDSLRLAPAPGVRSAEANARQLLFSAGAHDIDLRVEPAGRAWLVSGQVLGEPAAGGWAALQSMARANQASLNEQSEFSFPPVAAGQYRLFLHLTNVDIEVDELRIGN